MHFYYGVSISNTCYNDARDKQTPSVFIRTIETGIWGKKKLMNKALDPTKAKHALPGEKSRAPFTPKKEAVLKR